MKKQIRIILFLVATTMAQAACGPNGNKNNQQRMQSIPTVIDTLKQTHVKLNCIVSLAWGNQKDQIFPRIETGPFTATATNEQKYQIYAPTKVKVDAQGGVHIMKQYVNFDVTNENDISIFHYTPEGKWVGKTTLLPLNEKGLVAHYLYDYVADEKNNIYLLEGLVFEGNKKLNRLSKIDFTGKLLWETRGESSDEIEYATLKGTFGPLAITDDPKLYLTSPASADNASLAQIDCSNGKVKKVTLLKNGNATRIFLNDNNLLARGYYVVAEKETYFSFYDLSGKTETIHKDTARIWTDVKGFDNQGNLYTWNWQYGFKKLDRNGNVEAGLPLQNVVIRNSDNSVYTDWAEGDSVIIIRFTTSGKTIRYKLKFGDPAIGACRLLHVDDSGNFYFLCGDEIRVFSENGEVVKELTPASQYRFAIESNFHFENVCADTQGNVYLPVTDPGGIRIVKLSL